MGSAFLRFPPYRGVGRTWVVLQNRCGLRVRQTRWTHNWISASFTKVGLDIYVNFCTPT